MARSKDNSYKESTKGKVTFVMFQVEGDDETLQQGFHAMEQAFQRLAAPARVLAAPAAANLLPKQAALAEPSANGDGIPEELTVEEGEEIVETGNAERKTSAPRHYTQPKFLSDLPLTSDKGSFKDYATQKNPQTDNQKYLVASRWLQQHAKIDAITMDHVFTCFQAMGWPSQKDVTQPLRVMTRKGSYFQKNGKGAWKLTHVGADAADAIGS